MDIVESARAVEGWLTDREIMFLYKTASAMPSRGVVVEIGSWKGKSTICLAAGLKQAGGGTIYAIDPHIGSEECGKEKTFKQFKDNIKKLGFSKSVRPMVMKSEQAAKIWSGKKTRIDFLWIDGSHEYEDVKKDFDLWHGFLKDGGVIAFHDTFFREGPRKVVDQNIFGSNFKKIGFVDNITYAVKASGLSRTDRLSNSHKKIVKNLIYFKRKYNPLRLRKK